MKNSSRRKFLKRTGSALAVGAAASQFGIGTALAQGELRRGENQPLRPFDMPGAETPLANNGLLAGVPQDKPFHGSWMLLRVIGPVAGGLTLLLEEKQGKRPIRVDLCLIGGEPKAPIHTRYLELYVMDGGAESPALRSPCSMRSRCWPVESRSMNETPVCWRES